MAIVIVSGGFDPVHKGHVRMFRHAACLEEGLSKVICILNSDEWLIRKKGKPFMDWDGRREVIESIRWVDEVVPVKDDDGTVCEALRRLRSFYPTERLIFGNGGDRMPGNTPEALLCRELGIETAFNVGGGKIESSSWLINGKKDSGPVAQR